MAEPGPRIVSINELRFRPANSNDRARAGMEHAFKDVPDCSFGKDDGISPYMAADAGINDYPDAPASQAPLHDDVPDVARADGSPALSLSQKLLRSGFGLSVFLHAVVFCAVGYYATVKLPDETLLEGETVVAVEFYSETDSDVTAQTRQDEEDGEEEAVEKPVEQPKEEPKVEPKQEVVEPVEQEKPVVEEKPVEQAKLPDPVAKPVETPEKIEQPSVVTDQPEVLSTTGPSDFQIEAAAKQILQDTKIEPLPDTRPAMLVVPVEEPEKKRAQPLPHPISKPRVVQKVAEVKPVEIKPVEKPVQRPVVKKEEPKPVEKKPEPKKVEAKKEQPKKPSPKKEKEVKKKKVARDGNADFDSTKGSSTAKKKDGASQDASQGNSKMKVKGNASSSNYKGMLERKLARSAGRVKARARGLVVVAFTVNASGKVTKVSVRTSSGKPAVDKAALQAVRKASPFPAIPAELGVKTFSIDYMEVLIKG
jgi:protein TonB